MTTAVLVLGTLATVSCIGGVDQDSAIASTREWARLAPFPESARDLQVTAEGSMFTRAFRVSFRAPLKDVERWIDNSPGTRDVTPERIDESTRKYVINPGGGAQYAEVVVIMLDDETGLVKVYTYWS